MEYSRYTCYKFRRFARLFAKTVVEATVEPGFPVCESVLPLFVMSRRSWIQYTHWPPHGEEAHDWTVHPEDRS